ncbi:MULTISPECIES: hypothetical protein [Enterobacterales]|uniref:Transglutaminase-like domain-containing protein n=1 Tax=Klebsiella pneumoniae TaxID=573 RepID=A0A0B4ZR01_KLEPN|nr:MULTISPECIES: hypothetical protein [Enterobacterales]AJD77182.1 hypothetical protein [Klebsiella pneumoniae]MBF5072135.1 hypothetical protein [Escherichia coli]STS99944.1 Uncharacterised protein [Klebsiella pneumoniae]HAH6504770.1 hypothetical protein [Escherichia coli]HBQ2679469.1 hypothetical protein [Klebsiella pneumoniae]
MKTIKRFIVWVNYGLEGWSIFGSSDDWDEAVSIRSEAIDECNIDEEDIILAENKNELVVKPAAKQMTEWHRELEAVLMTLDDCQMECDGMTWAVSQLLNDAGVPHDCMYGFVRNEQTKDIVTPHFWVVLDDGWLVDLRLRMWLGDHDNIPHGVFHPDNEPGFFYKGDPVQNHKGMRLGKAVLDIMTDGKISHVKVPERQDGE